MKIKSIKHEELTPSVIGLLEGLFKYHRQFGETFELADDWRDHLEPCEYYFVAYDGDVPMGLAAMKHHKDPKIFKCNEWAEIYALFVLPSHRGQGVASLLMESFLHAAGTQDVRLYVAAGNVAAKTFYAARGFRPLTEVWRKVL